MAFWKRWTSCKLFCFRQQKYDVKVYINQMNFCNLLRRFILFLRSLSTLSLIERLSIKCEHFSSRAYKRIKTKQNCIFATMYIPSYVFVYGSDLLWSHKFNFVSLWSTLFDSLKYKWAQCSPFILTGSIYSCFFFISILLTIT